MHLVPCSVVLALLTAPISATVAFAPFASSKPLNPALFAAPHSRILRKLRGGEQETVHTDSIVGANEATAEDIPVDPPTPVAEESASVGSPQFSMSAAPLAASFTAAYKVYSTQLEQNPIKTKSLTSGVIFALSDYLAQRIERTDKNEPLNWKRITGGTLVGLLYFGPAAHYWYEMIFKLLPGTSLISTLQKAFWGQAIFGPVFTCIFFGTSLIQAGTFSLGSWWTKIVNDLPGAWLAGAGYWPLVDFISYSVVPVKWIPLFVNLCSLVWTVYLSIVANRSKGKSS